MSSDDKRSKHCPTFLQNVNFFYLWFEETHKKSNYFNVTLEDMRKTKLKNHFHELRFAQTGEREVLL